MKFLIAEDRLGSLIAEDLMCLGPTTTKSFLRSRLLLVQCSALEAFWLYVSNPEDLRCSWMMGLSSNPHMQVSYLSMLKSSYYVPSPTNPCFSYVTGNMPR